MAEVEEDEIDYEGMNNNLGQAFEAPPPWRSSTKVNFWCSLLFTSYSKQFIL